VQGTATKQQRARRRWRAQPTQIVFLALAAGVVVGTLLLLLPIAAQGQGGASPIQAFFTAVSAICVTGLVIVDTPTFWSGFGQVVILVLIQVGGLGVMTLASLIGLAVARRFSLQTRLTTAAETKSVGLDDVRRLIVGIVKITLAVEAVASLILFLWFALRYGEPIGTAAWHAVFHSVSAFNNAGFALFSNNLVDYVGDPVVSLVLSAAVIIGGLGFPVIIQLRRYWRTPLRWSMNTRIVLFATAALLVLGTLYITAIEWNNPATLGPLDWPQKILAGFFQSVQTRTAGFNSIDMAGTHDATLLGMTALMFIGAGPAGTAGGIKVTTFAVLLFILVAEIRGDVAVNIFGKRLSRAVHRQAISVVLLAVAAVISSTAAIMLMTGFGLGPVLFETVSAFATVGLSTGITADIPIPGQLILAALMFIGRLGPITFAAALALRERGILYQLPKERPIIG
jgi:potassium uptake TrkH family protein